MSDLARQRLKEIRTLRGWREAYRVAGLDDQGDRDFSDPKKNATKRRRLSRLINRQTSGAKELDSKQRQKVNRAYRYREKKGLFASARADRYIKKVNRFRSEARSQATKTFGARGISPDRDKLQRRLRQHQPLTAAEEARIREAFANAEEDGGKAIRAEYAKHMNRVQITSLPAKQRREFRRTFAKADRAAWRDSESDLSFEAWSKQSEQEKYGA